MTLSAFDGIVYINLDHRIDRNEAFLKEMKRLNVDMKGLHRISAYHDPLNGVRGCLQSHIEALKMMIDKGWKQGLILEDDCFFSESIDALLSIDGFFKQVVDDWDVLFLGGRFLDKEETQWESIVRIRESRRSHAYSVNQHYISTLLSCFEEAYEQVKHDLFYLHSQPHAVDFAWDKLQKADRWFALQESVAFQSPSYSDIEYRDRHERR